MPAPAMVISKYRLQTLHGPAHASYCFELTWMHAIHRPYAAQNTSKAYVLDVLRGLGRGLEESEAVPLRKLLSLLTAKPKVFHQEPTAQVRKVLYVL